MWDIRWTERSCPKWDVPSFPRYVYQVSVFSQFPEECNSLVPSYFIFFQRKRATQMLPFLLYLTSLKSERRQRIWELKNTFCGKTGLVPLCVNTNHLCGRHQGMKAFHFFLGYIWQYMYNIMYNLVKVIIGAWQKMYVNSNLYSEYAFVGPLSIKMTEHPWNQSILLRITNYMQQRKFWHQQ